MSRRCVISGKGVMAGNNRSHAENKTRRRFMPNLQVVSLTSQTLGESIRLRLSMAGLRTVEKRGGIDAYLMGERADGLTSDLRRLKRRIEAKHAASQAG